MTAIKKFNGYCDTLRGFELPAQRFPLPTQLPTDLTKLRDDDTLMTAVWTDSNPVNAQPWLSDASVRNAIRFMHQTDRCIEERRRLGREAENLLRWFSHELHVLECAKRVATG